MSLRKKGLYYHIELDDKKRKPFSRPIEISDRFRAKQVHDYICRLYLKTTTTDEKIENALKALLSIMTEMTILGIAFTPKLGLVGNAKKVEMTWLHLDQVLAKMRDRGFAQATWGRQ